MLEVLRVSINTVLVVLAVGSILGLIATCWIVFEGAAGGVRESRSRRENSESSEK